MKIIDKLRKRFCHHEFEVIGWTQLAGGHIALRDSCFEVLECKKCRKREVGEYRKLKDEEKEYMAEQFKKLIDKEKEKQNENIRDTI
jgi:hypothetical protein